MLHLAIETSGRSASVALLRDRRLLETARLESHQRTAQTLAPAIQQLFRAVSVRPAELELVSVAVGPGSFTGLRIGVTAAKTLCYATGAAAVAVDALETVANQAIRGTDLPETALLSVATGAYRGQVYRALYALEGEGAYHVVTPSDAVAQEVWLRELADLHAPHVFAAGSVLERPDLPLPATVTKMPASCWRPEAHTVGRIGLERFVRGEVDDFWTLSPRYLRPSAAEEQADGT